MLSLPFHRRYLRRTAWVTLLAWGLALLAGMANACQLQSDRPAAHAPIASIPGGSADRGSHAEDNGPTTDSGKAACVKFCDDESTALAKGKIAQVDLSAPAVVSNLAWNPIVSVAAVAARRSSERAMPPGPPLVIRFLRLTL